MPPIILRIILIVFGILLFVCAMLSYAGKKLKEGFFIYAFLTFECPIYLL